MMVAKRLKELRKEKGLSQKDVAKALEMSPTGYAGYEQGFTKPPINTLFVLAKFFDVSSDYLLGLTEVKYNQDELNFFNELKTKDLDQLIQEYNLTLGDEAMSKKDEQTLLRLIKSFINEKED